MFFLVYAISIVLGHLDKIFLSEDLYGQHVLQSFTHLSVYIVLSGQQYPFTAQYAGQGDSLVPVKGQSSQ